MQQSEVEALVKNAIPDAQVTVEGEGCSFTIHVVSESFEGQMPVKRQKAVMAPFADLIASGELHALSVKAKTPKEMQNA